MGDELVLGRLPRSRAAEEVLQRAVGVAAERGERRPGSLHVLLALAGDDGVQAILRDLDLDDLVPLVDELAPPRAPLSDQQVRAELVRAALEEQMRLASPPVPAFERFTPDARRAIRAAAESAALLEHREVDPFHRVDRVLAGSRQLRRTGAFADLGRRRLGAVGEAIDLVCRYGPPSFHQATGIFTPAARHVVAEGSLTVAYRLGHPQISTGHLLLATLDSHDRTTTAITRPHTQRLARTLTRGLPDAEHGDDEGPLAWIQFDSLIRTLTPGFRRILPAGWTIWGTARSDIHLRVPDSRSESDFQIRPGWIIAEPGPTPERLRRVTHWMLERLQAAVIDATGQSWPEGGDGSSHTVRRADRRPLQPHTAPRLRRPTIAGRHAARARPAPQHDDLHQLDIKQRRQRSAAPRRQPNTLATARSPSQKPNAERTLAGARQRPDSEPRPQTAGLPPGLDTSQSVGPLIPQSILWAALAALAGSCRPAPRTPPGGLWLPQVRTGATSSIRSSKIDSPSSRRWTGHLAAITRSLFSCSSLQLSGSRRTTLSWVGEPRSAV